MPAPVLKPLLLNPYSLILALWLGLVLVSSFYPAGYLVFGVIILTAVMPFLLAFVWLARSNVGALGVRLLEEWTWRVLLAIVLFFYAIFAKQWAAVTINHIFHVDPSYLGITSLVVAAFYLPLQVLYNTTVILPLWIISLVIGVLLTCAVVGQLFARTKFHKVLILAAAAFAFVYATNFFFAMIVNIVRNRDIVITQIALWADFNSDHLCTDAWASASDSVLFLGSDWVLAHYPHAAPGERLKPVHCNFSRSL
ncbi:hypothetical protein CCL10_05080 [Pseudomonas syringae]|nr:hypothetical protein CCL10_05080 [Pseudomonas syringae]